MAERTPGALNELVQLSFFADIGKAITSSATIHDTLDEVMAQIGAIFAAEYWSLLLRNAKTGGLTFTVVVGSGVERLKGVTIERNRGVVGWIAEKAQPVIIRDVAKDSRFDRSMDDLTGFRTKSIIGVPLKSRGRVFGVIELINKLNGDSFSPLELKILSTIADFAAIAIEKVYYMQALRRVALVDSLTGVYNRRNMMRFIEREIDRGRRHGTKFSLLIVDVDHFKEINDSYGHLTGDNVLKGLAAKLKAIVRKIDVVCRYGGDEFVIILPDTDEAAAAEARTRVLDALSALTVVPGVPISVSIGHYSGSAETVAEVFSAADAEMYREKEKSAPLDQDIENLSQNLGDFMDGEPEQDEEADPDEDK